MLNTSPRFSFDQALLRWYQRNGRKNLPWQQNKTRYSVWISEIMLQQTQVATVIPYFISFMQKFPTIVDLANAPQDEVLHLWTGLGYYARARNMHKAAQKIRDEFNGVFPNSFDDVLLLPGIGKSTAAAVLSLADNQAYVILDGNVKRVLARFFAVEGWPGNKKVEDKMWQLAESLKPSISTVKQSDIYSSYTQAIMDLGATLCKRSKPNCEDCPVQTHCLAYAQGRQQELPHKKPKKNIPTKYTYMIIPFLGARVLMHKRPSNGIWGGLWGFYESQTKIESLQDLPNNLATMFNTYTGKVIALDSFTHTFSHFQLQISPILLELDNANQISAQETSVNEPAPNTMAAENAPKWFTLEQEAQVGLAAPTLKIFKQIQTMY